MAKSAWKAGSRSYSREELVLRLDWRRLHEVFVAAIEDEVSGSAWRFQYRYADAVRSVGELHAAITDTEGRRTCATEPDEQYPCRTVREVYAAQEIAWDGWQPSPCGDHWRSFTSDEAEASRRCYQRTGLHWRPGIGIGTDNDSDASSATPDGTGPPGEHETAGTTPEHPPGPDRHALAGVGVIRADPLGS